MSISERESISKKRHVTSSLRKLPALHLSDPYLERLLTDEEDLLYILTIRNEIIENALDKCFESYMKDQSVRFVTDCLHKAYIDVINSAFMHYDATLIDTTRDLWQTDVQFQPLALDNYCEFAVPFETDVETQVEVKSPPIYSNITMTMASLGEVPDRSDDTVFPTEIEQEIEESVESSQSSVDKFENVFLYDSASASWVLEQEEKHRTRTPSTSELFEEITSEASFFTGVAEAEQHYLPPIEQVRCDYQLLKSGEGSIEKSLLPVLRPNKKSFAGALPPLRCKAKFKSGDTSKMAVRFGKSMSSVDRLLHNASVVKNVQLKETASTTKTLEKLDAADGDEQNKKEKKVDIVI